jgi:hypothetical protein
MQPIKDINAKNEKFKKNEINIKTIGNNQITPIKIRTILP